MHGNKDSENKVEGHHTTFDGAVFTRRSRRRKTNGEGGGMVNCLGRYQLVHHGLMLLLLTRATTEDGLKAAQSVPGHDGLPSPARSWIKTPQLRTPHQTRVIRGLLNLN